MAFSASILERKINVESNKLKQKSKNQLCEDIFKLYSQAIYSDISIKTDTSIVKSHRCILETRVPEFYKTYSLKPELIKNIPVEEFESFIRNIYHVSDIKTEEQRILRYMNSFINSNSSSSCCSSTPDPDDTRNSSFSHLNIEIRKANALTIASNHLNWSRLLHLSNSNNSIYYSLVDHQSLLLSDYSDVDEDRTKEMNICKNLAESQSSFNTQSHPDNEEIISTETEISSRQYVTANGVESLENMPDGNKKSKEVKCFIDASDLVDENITCDSLDSWKFGSQSFSTISSENIQPESNNMDQPSCTAKNKSLTCSTSTALVHNTSDNCIYPITPQNSFAVDAHTIKHLMDNEEGQLTKFASGKRDIKCDSDDKEFRSEDEFQKENTSALSLNLIDHNIQNDSHNSTLNMSKNSSEYFTANSTINNTIYDEVESETKSDKINISLSTAEARELFPDFRDHLCEKYECAKSNHEYTNSELGHLGQFDELLKRDTDFLFLQYNLEEILLSNTNSRMKSSDVAMHKFLIKQYENKYGSNTISVYLKKLMKDLLIGKSGIYNNDKTTDESNVDDLFKKLISIKNNDIKSNEVNVTKYETNNSKSCGFFIDLGLSKSSSESNKSDQTCSKEEITPSNNPSKQLFSMFIDFGNSTDSDTSMEIQNKLQKKKKQYINKMDQKVRESRISIDAKKKISTAVSIKSTKEKNFLNASSMLKSWDVDCKSNAVNCTENSSSAKHKRSRSVSEKPSQLYDDDVETKTEISELPPLSIANADSTNEITMNGDSDDISINNSLSYSTDQDQDSKIISSCSTNSKTCPKSPVNSVVENKTQKVAINGSSSFVKLSDLDKDPKPFVTSSSESWSQTRMSKSVTTAVEPNWLETKFLNGSINSRSLTRIFPDLSTSSLSAKQNSDIDDNTVSISTMSSVPSSLANSMYESNAENSNNQTKKDCNSLGQDLLRMLLDGISTDVVVEVAGRRIKAHKCILTSRCQYFAALLSGGWVESAGNVISLQGFTYSVVQFALRYIYSGENDIPETIDIGELATLADYLCLEGLQEIVSSHLKIKFCHCFHKPCNICSIGVIECLQIALNHGLDDLRRHCFRWITKHFVRLWCTKKFASQSWEFIDRCYNQHVANMTVNNVFETLMNCDKLFSVLPQTRWAEPSFTVTRKLHDACIKFLANNFLEFLKCESFTSFASNRTWGIVLMDEKTQHVCSKMRTDQLCLSYAYICNEHKLATSTHENEELIELLSRVKNRLEGTLVKTALQASQCNSWFQMSAELRKHIQRCAGLTFFPTDIKRRPESLKTKSSIVPSSGSRTVDLQQVKTAICQQNRRTATRSSEPREFKPRVHERLSNSQTRSSSTKQTISNHSNKENKTVKNTIHVNGASKNSYTNKYANVKPRYMDRKSELVADKTASETTPSETSEIERKPPTGKRATKSLVTSVDLSPAVMVRATARAVSMSKIPVSVRTPSQKRYESDQGDTTSGSDNNGVGRRSVRGMTPLTSSFSAASNNNVRKNNGNFTRQWSAPSNSRSNLKSSNSSSRAGSQPPAVITTTKSATRVRRNTTNDWNAIKTTSSSKTKITTTTTTNNNNPLNENLAKNITSSNRSYMRPTQSANNRRYQQKLSSKTLSLPLPVLSNTATDENGSGEGRHPLSVNNASLSSPEGDYTKCPSDDQSSSKKSGSSNSSESDPLPITKPPPVLRRDGTFCIEEPKLLKKHSSDEREDIIV